MADNNGGGFITGLAGAVKGEQKEIATLPMAKWEDFGRIRAQTRGLVEFRIAQLFVGVLCAMAWANVVYQYALSEVKYTNSLSLVIQIILSIIALFVVCAFVFDARRSIDDSGMRFAVYTVIGIAWVLFALVVAERIAWVLINSFNLGYASIYQIVVCGWIPFALSVLSLAIIPDYQVGRFAFWHELVNQPEASSEKQVLDRTAIELKQMELDAKHDDMIDAERAEYEDRIAELEAKIERLVNTKATHHLIPHNHGSARGFASIEYTEPEWDSLKAFVTGWDNRGTARDNWTTREAEQKHGSRIPEPHWEKIVADLKAVGVLNERGKPVMKSDEAAQVVGL